MPPPSAGPVLVGRPLDCPICASLLSDPRITPCGHTFCANCLSAHISAASNCPVCQHPLSPSDIYPNYLAASLSRANINTQGADGINVDELDNEQADRLLQSLLRRKRTRSRQNERIGYRLMAKFLDQCRGEKRASLRKVLDELKLIEEDLRILKTQIQQDNDCTDLVGRSLMLEKFKDNVEKHYFECRKMGAGEPVKQVVDMLVEATKFSAARRRGGTQHVDILRSNHNLISSVEFNAPATLFATAGVTKRIKVFEFDPMLQDVEEDINNTASSLDRHHYPVLEIPTVAKLSCLSWSKGKASVLAAATYKGDILIHDTETNTLLQTLREHSKRAWYVDYSPVRHPWLLSGSDDHTVKLWDVNRLPSRSVITLKSTASVCCVKFNPEDAHQMAFASADHNVYSYDLRQPSSPMCVFEGHWRAVSHVLFLNRSELVSLSTDSSCKLWNVQKQEPGLSYAGHTNERHFVGLTGNKDFFACGSEDNAVYIYHKGFSGPVVRYAFGSGAGLVSTVAWKPQSNLIIAANNNGGIEIMEVYGDGS